MVCGADARAGGATRLLSISSNAVESGRMAGREYFDINLTGVPSGDRNIHGGAMKLWRRWGNQYSIKWRSHDFLNLAVARAWRGMRVSGIL